jgi:hypothetical protein
MSDEPSADPTAGKKRWQFSVRGLLLFTAVVAAVLSVAAQLPALFHVLLITASIGCFLAAAMWTANFATSETRPLLAACTWLVFGAFFSQYGATAALLVREHRESQTPMWGFVVGGIAAVMAACALVCFYRAGRAVVRWRRGRDSVSDKTDTR